MKTSMRFDFADLRLFLFVVEAASITHGAARAGMALASASERIRLMEESLGAALLDRHRRGVRVTPAGAALASRAIGHSTVGADARGTLGVCQRRQGPRAPICQYDGNRRVSSGQLGRLLVAASSVRY